MQTHPMLKFRPMESGGLPPGEFSTLTAICDAMLPPDHPPWRETVPERAAAVLAQLPNTDDLAQLRQLLRWLESPIANLAISGRARAFSALSRPEREASLRTMARHRLNPIRGAFQALKRLTTLLYYADVDAGGLNPTWPSLGYPGPVLEPPDTAKSIRPLPVDKDIVVDCDVVVVGSGAGGGVVAGELAAAGRDVVVVEKGSYYNEADFNQLEWEAFQKRYLYGGLLSTSDQAIGILAGSCLGGGTVVNYTTSFRTPDRLRQEWARRSGLSFLTGEDFSRSLDAVCDRLGVNVDHNRPGARDALMARGLEALGWHVGRMPRNVQGCTQDNVCGYCGFGCVRGAKRSTLKTYLQQAFDLGARILVDCAVERVLLENGRATGVSAVSRAGHRITVRARRVVVCAGAIESPALLLRSGVDGPVGENLRLHPVTAVWGVFDEEVRPWTGTIQALYSDQFADLDDGYGLKFETTGIHPLLLSYATAWTGGREFDRAMGRLPHVAPIGILLRDRDGGRVTVNRAGVPVVHYQVSSYDRRHVRRGVEGAARVLQAAGAAQVNSSQSEPVIMRRDGDFSVDDWLRRVDRVGYGPNQTAYFSWHQMGTCRMGASRATSVTAETGEVHSVKDLYVADGSLFPSASGVNPMITIAALAHWVARAVDASLS